MNRRQALKAMVCGLGVLGCREDEAVESVPIRPCDVNDLFRAIAMVESGGDNSKIGKAGEAGQYQLTRIYVDDVNRIIRCPAYLYVHRLCPCFSKKMMLVYWGHYATVERLGRVATLEDLARIHNGGPNGWRKKCTEKYWKKVKIELERDRK